MFAAGLGACGLVASAAVTDGSVGSSPPDAVIRAVQSALHAQPASAGNSSVAPVNFPFVALADDGVHTLQKGPPLIQVIRFPREEGIEGVVRAERDDEAGDRERVYRSTLAGEGWYRRESRARR